MQESIKEFVSVKECISEGEGREREREREREMMCVNQYDQIGRIFALWATFKASGNN